MPTSLAAACQLLLDRCEKLDSADRKIFECVAVKGYCFPDIAERLGRYAAFLRTAGIRLDDVAFEESVVPAPHGPRSIAANGIAFLVRYERADAVADTLTRTLPGCKWEPTLRAMRIPGNLMVVESLRKMAMEGFEFCESADRLCEEVAQAAAERAKTSRAPTGHFRIEGLLGALRPYQQAGVEFATRTGCALIGDDMGLGKTAQALATVQALQAWPAVVVTIASVTLGWEAEAHKWLSGVRCVHWEGRTGTPAGADPVSDDDHVLHIVNYANLSYRLDELLAVNPRAVIFDESHHLKSGKSARTLAALALARRRPVRLLLSGTPVLNNPAELLPQLQILGSKVMTALGGWSHITSRYIAKKMKQFAKGKVGWDFSGSAHLPEFHERLRATCLLRRTKDQVLPELPPRIVTHVPLGMSPDGWTRYETAAKDIQGWLAAKAAVDPAWETTIAHLGAEEREYARAARYAEAIDRLDGMELLLKLGTLRQVAAEGKLPLAVEWCRELCAARKLVVFAHHKTVVRGLAAALRTDCGALLIDGETSAEQRQARVRSFVASPDCRMLSVSITAGGTGLDGLQHAAGDVAFLEYPWTPASLDQASSRVHRMGQPGTVHEWHLLARGTVDDDLAALLDVKAEMSATITDGIKPRQTAIAKGRALARRITCAPGSHKPS